VEKEISQRAGTIAVEDEPLGDIYELDGD